MSDKHDDYRRQAEYCQRMARRADTMEGKASWLRLASKWLGLMEPPRPASDEDKFAAMVDSHSTGQEGSSSKH